MADNAGEHLEIAELVRAIDENPDELYNDYTPSVQRLIDKGLAGAAAVVPLLNTDDQMTRRRAQRVLEGVVKARFGWKAGMGFADAGAQEQALAVLAANGNYDAAASEEQRKHSAGLWRRWIEDQREGKDR